MYHTGMDKNKSKKIFNPRKTKGQRKYLRNNMTKAEIILWSKLKGRQLHGYKFRRQHGIGDYIVDFYCPDLNLAVEIDGKTHYTQSGVLHDQIRTKFLEDHEIFVQRFINAEVKQNVDSVVQKLSAIIKHLEKMNI